MAQQSSILVAMSGGVDSSVTAALLARAGYRVEGVFMQVGQAAAEAVHDACRVADHLGIELHVVDLRGRMAEIIDYFIAEYRAARTPNPCIMCNRRLKFGALLDLAGTWGLEGFATGHYARVVAQAGRTRLCRAANPAKDQSYALFAIRRETLGRLRLPLGEYAKDEVRALARDFDLPVHAKGESQEICFVPEDDYVRFLLARAPDLAQPGDVVDPDGKVLGRHEGVFRYTIGQRRGLGVALGTPAYVVHLDAVRRQVVLGPRALVRRRRLRARQLNWLIEPPGEAFDATVQIRYNHRGAPARVQLLPDDAVEVTFAEPVEAITPGQAAVFFDEQQAVVGGGWIEQGD